MRRMTIKQAKAMGMTIPEARKGTKGRSRVKPAYGVFEALCEAHGMPKPIPELKFSARGWRFDFAWPDGLFEGPGGLALEVEGGIWTNGAHVRGKHFKSDMEKYNEAALLGWKVLRCTPEDIESGEVFALLRRAFGMEGEQS